MWCVALIAPGSHPAPAKETRLRVKMVLQTAGRAVTGWNSVPVDSIQINQSILDLLSYSAITLSVVKPSLNRDFWALGLRLKTVTVEISGRDAWQLGGDHDSSWCVWRAVETMFSHLLVYLWVDINMCVCGWVQWYTWTTEFSYHSLLHEKSLY